MVNVVESNNRRAPPKRAVDVFPELTEEIDERIARHFAQNEANLRKLLFNGLLTVLTPLIAMVFYLGQLNQDFKQALETNQRQDATLERRADWSERKDALDDDVIRFLETLGYKPPPWYAGRDYEETNR